MDTLRRDGLAGTELANAQVDTIRLKMLKIGARIVCSVRRIVFHLAGAEPYYPVLKVRYPMLHQAKDLKILILYVGVRRRMRESKPAVPDFCPNRSTPGCIDIPMKYSG